MSRSRRRTIEQAVESVRGYHRIFPEQAERSMKFHEDQAARALVISQSWASIRETAPNRGEKWSATYHARKWLREAHEYEAIAVMLKTEFVR